MCLFIQISIIFFLVKITNHSVIVIGIGENNALVKKNIVAVRDLKKEIKTSGKKKRKLYTNYILIFNLNIKYQNMYHGNS